MAKDALEAGEESSYNGGIEEGALEATCESKNRCVGKEVLQAGDAPRGDDIREKVPETRQALEAGEAFEASRADALARQAKQARLENPLAAALEEATVTTVVDGHARKGCQFDVPPPFASRLASPLWGRLDRCNG